MTHIKSHNAPETLNERDHDDAQQCYAPARIHYLLFTVRTHVIFLKRPLCGQLLYNAE